MSRPVGSTAGDAVTNQKDGRQWHWLKDGFYILLAFLLFLFSIDLMGASILQFGEQTVNQMLIAAENPFVSLFIGLLVTAVIQSSSTTTAMIIAFVATGSMPLTTAVPMVMGANIGTTITPTIISLSFIARRNQFRKALATGAVHNLFNIFVVLLLFPLELQYGLLSGTAESIASLLFSEDGAKVSGSTGAGFLFKPIVQYIIGNIDFLLIPLILSAVLMFTSIKLLSRLISRQLIAESRNRLENVAFSTTFRSFGLGVLLTAGVQSSSVTTSLMVPLVASSRVSLKKAWPFIMGANIGTTITAFIAALFKTEAALSLAIVHLVFNLVGVLLFLPIKNLRNLPVKLANMLGTYTFSHRLVGLAYIVLIFFLLPLLLIYISR